MFTGMFLLVLIDQADPDCFAVRVLGGVPGVGYCGSLEAARGPTHGVQLDRSRSRHGGGTVVIRTDTRISVVWGVHRPAR